MKEVNHIRDILIPFLVTYGLQVVGAILIFIIGWVLSKWLVKRAEKFIIHSEHIDTTLAPILTATLRVIILTVTLLAVLSKFGFKTTSFVALIGSIGLGIGLALQGTLSNIASGMMLLTLRPFTVGDSVNINGTIGVIDEIGLFVTELHKFDNVFVSIPNSKVWGNEIINYTHNDTRRVDMEFGIHYEDDINKAMRVISEVLGNEERVLAEPEPLIGVGALSDSSVNIIVRPWTQPANWWQLQLDLNKRIKQRFDEENITIPFPQRDVHFFGENGSGESSPEQDAK